MSADRKPLSSYWTPRYWPIWLAIGLLRLVCLLPHRAALALGRFVGRIGHSLSDSRRAIVRRNVGLCFPELALVQRNALAKQHFEALGMSLIEIGLGRWASDKHLAKITEINGVDHLRTAVESGNGVILVTAHFTTLEISGRVLALNSPPFDAVFRRNRSDFITELLRSGRERAASDTIEKHDIKKMVRSLRAGRPVWYAPDQSYNRKGSELIEFFGIPTMHTTATSTLARLGRAVTIPFLPLRKKDGSYELSLLPPLEDFPGDDPIEDTRRYVAVIEEHVRKCPEQYFWVHRKFKDLPEPHPNYYSDLAALK